MSCRASYGLLPYFLGLLIFVVCSPWAYGSAGAGAENRSVQESPDEAALAAAEPLVVGHCSACHSLRLVSSQRGDATFWLNTIRWMQKTQKLWEIPEDQEQQIIRYLSHVYAEESAGRRPLLPLALQDQKYWPSNK